MAKIQVTAKLYDAGQGFVCLDLPKRASEALGKRGRIVVKGTVNGFQIRTSVSPDGMGGHFMLVNKTMQAGANASSGDAVSAVLEVDTTPPTDIRRSLAVGNGLFEGTQSGGELLQTPPFS